jgi:CNT family concentrative nucleoside transporter
LARWATWAAVRRAFAFQVLPITFHASFFAILYYLAYAVIVRGGHRDAESHGGHGAKSLNVAASIFMGQTEAPLTIRPFSRNDATELFTVMSSGMAHASGRSWPPTSHRARRN